VQRGHNPISRQKGQYSYRARQVIIQNDSDVALCISNIFRLYVDSLNIYYLLLT